MSKKWRMPAWMKPYAAMIVNTGGNDVVDLMNKDVDSRINLPLAMIQVCIDSQVTLLTALHDKGHLK